MLARLKPLSFFLSTLRIFLTAIYQPILLQLGADFTIMNSYYGFLLVSSSVIAIFRMPTNTAFDYALVKLRWDKDPSQLEFILGSKTCLFALACIAYIVLGVSIHHIYIVAMRFYGLAYDANTMLLISSVIMVFCIFNNQELVNYFFLRQKNILGLSLSLIPSIVLLSGIRLITIFGFQSYIAFASTFLMATNLLITYALIRNTFAPFSWLNRFLELNLMDHMLSLLKSSTLTKLALIAESVSISMFAANSAFLYSLTKSITTSISSVYLDTLGKSRIVKTQLYISSHRIDSIKVLISKDRRTVMLITSFCIASVLILMPFSSYLGTILNISSIFLIKIMALFLVLAGYFAATCHAPLITKSVNSLNLALSLRPVNIKLSILFSFIFVVSSVCFSAAGVGLSLSAYYLSGLFFASNRLKSCIF